MLRHRFLLSEGAEDQLRLSRRALERRHLGDDALSVTAVTLLSATSSWLMAYLRLFLPQRGTQSLRFPDHHFPVMRICAAPAGQTGSFQLKNVIATAECPCWANPHVRSQLGVGSRAPSDSFGIGCSEKHYSPRLQTTPPAPQFPQFDLAHTKAAEDFGVVLSEFTGGGGYPHPVADPDRGADVRDLAQFRVVRILHKAAVANLGRQTSARNHRPGRTAHRPLRALRRNRWWSWSSAPRSSRPPAHRGFATRCWLVAKRGSSHHSGCSNALTQRAQTASPAAPTIR